MSPAAAPSAELVDMKDTQQLRSVYGAFTTGVVVVTVGGQSPRGMTANSFTSVSLDPPLVLVCVNKDAVMHSSLALSPTFSVSVLSAGQEHLARHFASRSRPAGMGQFDAVDLLPGRAADGPLLADAVAHLECEKWQIYDGGDHSIFLGKVIGADRHPDQDALIFSNGRFHLPAAQRSEGRAA